MSLISIIFPAFNEAENLEELHRRLQTAIGNIREHTFEFIFIDDGSSDDTPEILRKLHGQDQRIRVIRFARNFGSHAALAAGLHLCKGDGAIILAADLQDPPDLIARLLAEWKKGIKIVWGARVKREGESRRTKLFSRLYYKLINWLTTVRMSSLGTDVFLADRRVIEAFKQVSEKHTSIFMMLAWLGFSQTTIEYVKQARYKGVSKWSMGKKIKLVLDSILAFSDIPIRYISVLGFITALLGFFYAVFIFWAYLFRGMPVQGWSSLMVAILVIGGIQMIMLGILGEYLWRAFDESRKRPRYVIEYTLE